MYGENINQLTKLRDAQGNTYAITDYTSRDLYSTVELLDGYSCEKVRLFSYEEGEQVVTSANMPIGLRRTATELETNARASEMADTEAFLLMNIAIQTYQHAFPQGPVDALTWADEDPALLRGSCQPTNPALCTLHERIVVKFEGAGIKDYQVMHYGKFPPGFGVYTTHGIASTSDRTYANSSVPSEEVKRPFDLPVAISPTEEYSVILANPTGEPILIPDDAGVTGDQAAYKSVIRVVCYLEGLHKRGVA